MTIKGSRKNGEVILGDLDYDGRVILYIIKGLSTLNTLDTANYFLLALTDILRPS